MASSRKYPSKPIGRVIVDAATGKKTLQLNLRGLPIELWRMLDDATTDVIRISQGGGSERAVHSRVRNRLEQFFEGVLSARNRSARRPVQLYESERREAAVEFMRSLHESGVPYRNLPAKAEAHFRSLPPQRDVTEQLRNLSKRTYITWRDEDLYDLKPQD